MTNSIVPRDTGAHNDQREAVEDAVAADPVRAVEQAVPAARVGHPGVHRTDLGWLQMSDHVLAAGRVA